MFSFICKVHRLKVATHHTSNPLKIVCFCKILQNKSIFRLCDNRKIEVSIHLKSVLLLIYPFSEILLTKKYDIK